MEDKRNNIFLVTGGTGGHVFPALSLYNFLKNKGISSLIITDLRGLNYIDINKYNSKKILSDHLKKKNFQVLKSLFILCIGFVQFSILLIKKKPKIIITFGSYTSFMPILSAYLLKSLFKIKIYFHEQNSVIGNVHNLMSFSSNKIFVTFENTKGIKKQYLNKVVYSGIPIRDEINNFKRDIFKKENNKKQFKFFIVGGSQGASNLSNLIVNLFLKLPEEYQKSIHLTIQSPDKDIEKLKYILNNTKINYIIKKFYIDIYNIIIKSDLCISRSGSSILNELIRLNTPSILIPLPHAVLNHQYYNAEFLSNRNGAILIEEKEINTIKTIKKIKSIIKDPNILNDMFIQLTKIKKIDSNEVIYNEIFS